MQQVLSANQIDNRPMVAGRQNKIFIWVLFLLWPFMSFLVAAKNFRAPWAKNIIWAFTVFYGVTFTISQDNKESDINRYISWFHYMHYTDMSLGELWDLLYVHEDYADIGQPLLSLVIAKFTNNHVWLITAFGFVFGYFYSRNVWYLIQKIEIKNHAKLYFMLFILALVIPFWNIAGFRFWTAGHIFIFGALPVIFEKKNRYFFIALLSPLVHYTFTFPVIILLIYYLAGHGKLVRNGYFLLFIISMFVTEINNAAISDLVASYLPDIFSERTSGYLDEEYAENVQKVAQQGNWYATFYLTALKWSVTAFLIYIYVKRKHVFTDIRFRRFYSFTILFYAFANVMTLIPSGIRFTIIANFFAVGVLLYFINFAPTERRITLLYRCVLPLLIIFVIVSVRLGFSSLGVVTVIGNGITALFVDNEVALIDLIK